MDRADYAHWNSADVARLLALLESERRYYQEIVAGIPVGLLVVTSDLQIVSANAAVRRMFNFRSADALRGSLEFLLPGAILDEVLNVLRSNRPQVGLTVTTRPELGSRHLRVSIRPMAGWDVDNPREALLTIEDVPGVQAAAALEAPEETKTEAPAEPVERALIRDVNAAVWACELPDMRFSFVSEGAVRMLGFTAQHWMETPNFWSERIDPEDREGLLARYLQAMTGDGHYSGEFRARTADGRSLWMHESARVVDRADGSRYIAGCSVEISNRAEVEKATIQRERLDALKSLSARLAHDLNNLLMIVTGYTEDALAGVSEGTAVHSGLRAIRTAGQRLAAIAGQLRTFATYAPAEPGAVEVNALLSRVQKRVNRGRVKVQPGAAPVWVRADQEQLEASIYAAVARALAATPDGGDVTLSVSETGGFATIEIRDTAAAITEEEHRAFFEQLLGGRRRSEEEVAALAGAYLAVEHWGGRISLEPTEGGNIVRLTLPVTEAPAASKQEAPAPAAPERTSKTILVVEDEAGIRALLRKILERHGYEVLEAPRASDALDILQNSAIDLLITDVVMPDMSGQRLAARLRERRPDARVLFISGYTEDTSMYKREFGAETAFLQKPFTLGALVSKVRELLSGE